MYIVYFHYKWSANDNDDNVVNATTHPSLLGIVFSSSNVNWLYDTKVLEENFGSFMFFLYQIATMQKV